jgi:hypothetical protein
MERFDAAWRLIKDCTDELWSINLRDMANIIGFSKFPVGWRWAEYAASPLSRERPFEASLQKVGALGSSAPLKPTVEGEKAIAASLVNRRTTVEKQIRRMIVRREIVAELTDENMISHDLDDRLRLNEALNFDVLGNAIGFHDLGPGSSWSFSTSLPNLLAALEEKKGWKRNSSKNDWLMFERLARIEFETRGVPDVLEKMMGVLIEKYQKIEENADEPNRTEILQLLSQLKTEYSESEI